MTKYRIVVGTSHTFPYCVEKKEKGWFSFWHEIDRGTNLDDAQQKIRNHIAAKVPKVGSIVYEYDEADLLVDKLKGTV